MDAKLTLKLSKRAIENAKRFARKNNQSLSSLVERYFNLLSEKERYSEIEISPNVKELSGIIKLDEYFNLRDEYRKHIMEKYD